jgi:hypothetical protein
MVYDYMLSRIGTEVAREKLFAFALAQMGITDPNMPGIGNIFNLKPEFILALVEGINETYGGWDGYVKDVLGFSAEDLDTIKKNLRS